MLKNAKKVISTVLILSMVISGGSNFAAEAAAKTTKTTAKKKVTVAAAKTAATKTTVSKAKNVIVLIGDGMNSSVVTLARWYKGSKLNLDQMVTGAVTNFNENSVITDSAPAATALATGYKSDNGYVSVYPSEKTVPEKKDIPEDDQYKPVATVLEAAKLLGKSTGIVSTSQVQHATPACFTAHNYNRNDYCDIAEQQVYEGLDVVLGGGKQYLVVGNDENNPDNAAYGRKDGDDLVQQIKSEGYDFVENTQAMENSKSKKLWGMFANEGMDYDIDRDPSKQPSLEQMTSKALSVLGQNKNGFFLMVEGSEIDWAAHANDPVGAVTDTLAFDKAVGKALDFAKKDKNTLVIALTDHGCGGMTIGNANTSGGNSNYGINSYSNLQLSSVLNPLKKTTATLQGIQKLFNADRSNVKEVLQQQYGITDLTDKEVDTIKSASQSSLQTVLGQIISTRTAIGWTTTGHTGEDVTLYAYGPMKPTGLVDNTDIAKTIAKAMNVSLNDVNQELYINIEDGLGAIKDANADLDTTDPANPVLVVTKGSNKIELPISTSKIIINGKVSYLEGLNIQTKSGDIYISADAIEKIANLK